MGPSAGDRPAGGQGQGPGPGPAKGPTPGGEKKIIIQSDEGWKADAQREKERLQEKAKEDEQARRAAAMPPPTFLTLASDLGFQAMFAMGLAEIEGAGRRIDLPSARYAIDLLGMLEEKTKGNLTAEEAATLKDLLQNLRLAFTQVARAAVAAAAEARAAGGPGGIPDLGAGKKP
jgi:hypothetical protein